MWNSYIQFDIIYFLNEAFIKDSSEETLPIVTKVESPDEIEDMFNTNSLKGQSVKLIFLW